MRRLTREDLISGVALVVVVGITLVLVAQYIGWLSAVLATVGLSAASTALTFGALRQTRRSAEKMLQLVVGLVREGGSRGAPSARLADIITALPFTEQLYVFRKVINAQPYSDDQKALLLEVVPSMLREYENLVPVERVMRAVGQIADPDRLR